MNNIASVINFIKLTTKKDLYNGPKLASFIYIIFYNIYILAGDLLYCELAHRIYNYFQRGHVF